MREFGDTDVLRMEQLPVPSPGAGEVLIEVHSVSVNQTLDIAVRQGGYRTDLRFPVVLGTDPAGIVVATGDGVPQSRCGERVSVVASIRCGECRFCRMGREDSCPRSRHLGLDRWGGYAEYVTVPVENVFPIPDNLSFAEASVVTRHFPTAINLLLNHARLEKDEWVLIMGAAGALGSCGVQIARHQGARVIAAAGADSRAEAARGLRRRVHGQLPGAGPGAGSASHHGRPRRRRAVREHRRPDAVARGLQQPRLRGPPGDRRAPTAAAPCRWT